MSILGKNKEIETYKVVALDGQEVTFDKETNLIIPDEKYKDRIYFKEERAKMILDSRNILDSSPYKSYKPIYLDPSLKTGQSSTYVEFKKWQDLYLKAPIKGAIAPWTKKEKAYYQSLTTKRERYKYLIIRSGLRSAVIDIPYDAYCGVDDNGKLINKDYKDLYKEVERNRGNVHLSDGYLAMSEWELAAGILGDVTGFAMYSASHGFKARMRQARFLVMQLSGIGEINSYTKIPHRFKSYADRSELGLDGIHKNMLRAQMILNLSQTIQPDEFNMLPYLDELMGVDWVMDFNIYPYAKDPQGNLICNLYDRKKEGTLKDPRDSDSTKESREEFMDGIKVGIEKTKQYFTSGGFREGQNIELYIYMTLLESKVVAITPPQGYPNAPTYYIPEELESIYKEGKLDKRLNPTIPAIQRENFPQELRDKIDSYAKKHNIKD